MSVPDQSHIDRVRDALWDASGSNASVMVGSGLTRGAARRTPGTAEPPLLADLARELFRKLYPGETSEGDSAFNGSAIPVERLAQEYEIAFGRTDLHELLRKQVRDEELSPSDVHSELLRLPWRDVFTTNWDTLLERARIQVPERAYSVVVNMDEIPLARHPRIVKLHGSLPAQFPLIFTEEDYRTYPEQFAPFVNTVQQAMMETVLCLIGFSGDDPNFLHWSGWVRDNLGSSAPRIYLMGWLDLSPHRRHMLEARGVVPIDLAHHPRARDWPDHQRHRNATEWVLHTLRAGRPYDVTYWPMPLTHPKPAVPQTLEPVVQVPSTFPIEEPERSSQVDVGEVQRVVEAWGSNRRLYPGWLVFPHGEGRQGVQRRTSFWEDQILRVLEELDPLDGLKAIRELVWRKEILLEPITHETELAAENVLAAVDCDRRTVHGSDAQADWVETREAWREVALALLPAARFRLDRDTFMRRLDTLGPFADEDGETQNRIRHEQCLWLAHWLKLDELESLLDDWQTEDGDPAWMIRKAALLWELDRGAEGGALVQDALAELRQGYSREPTAASASREGWALWSEFDTSTRHTVWRRWHELARWKGDASSERSNVEEAMRAGAAAPEAPSFDLGVQRISVQFVNQDVEQAAYRAMRLVEVAGLPLVTRDESGVGMQIAVPLMTTAAENLAPGHPELAISLVLRACSSETDKTLDRVVSRARIATLTDSSISALASTCIDAVQRMLPMLASVHRASRLAHWIPRTTVAMEVLSRLSVRADSDQVETAFDLSLECYRSRQLLQEVTLRGAAAALLRRTWEALPEGRRSDRILDVLGTPIPGVGDYSDIGTELFDDPGKVVQADDIPRTRTPGSAHLWQTVTNLLVRGLSSGVEARAIAIRRLLPLVVSGALSDEERQAVGRALWSEGPAQDDDLPTLPPNLYDFVLLLFPEPFDDLAEQRFRQKWLPTGGARSDDPARALEVLDQVGTAILQLRNRGRSLRMSDEERDVLVAAVGQWAETPVPGPTPEFLLPFTSTRETGALAGLVAIVAEVPIPSEVGSAVYQRAQAMTGVGMGGFELASGLARVLPGRVDEIATWLRAGVVSGDPHTARSAMRGLQSWLEASLDEDTAGQPLPQDLIREIGLVIASRRGVALPQALQAAAWIFDNGPAETQTALKPLVLQGLMYLIQELQYERQRAQDGDIDVPWARTLCARLARSMAESGLEHEPAVANWLELARRDPLPEVRGAVMSD